MTRTTEGLVLLLKKLRKSKKGVFICGNGGSACNSIHFAEDLMGRGVRAASLCDIGFLTATANDIGYDDVFSRPLKIWGDKGDLLITFSCSGTSKNVVRAIKTAKEMGIIVYSMPTNKDTGSITPRTEDVHSTIIHDVYIALNENS